ncbi:MAG: class I SAM-dependent methyltransferase [Alphaproteobacteria bacterium]|nr:class I SAM-dependent methyltransferase [Alphaproteobacteria bacterium]
MRKIVWAAVAALAFTAPALAEATPEQIQAAIADTTRPADDVERDAARHPAELLAYSGVQEGSVVVDWIPGGGYFTRLFSDIAGPGGKVYAWVPQEIAGEHDIGTHATALAAERKNVETVIEPLNGPTKIANVDIVWTSQNYHDLHTSFMKGADVAAFNKRVYDMLKPGGYFIVVDHVAAEGSGLEAPEKLHRIDPAIVKKEVEAAGFQFEGESFVLSNPADTHELMVFDEKIRGKTDQFVYRFKKPAA